MRGQRAMKAVVSLVGLSGMLMLPASTQASPPIRFLICQPGGPDLAKDQQAVIERLYRYLERKTGLASGQIVGVYTNTRAACEKELKTPPTVFFPSLPIFMEYRKRLKLKAVAQLQLQGRTRDNFYVMAQKGSGLTLDQLKGKTLVGTHLDSQQFMADIVLEGRVKLADVTLKSERLGLRAIRAVTRGRADAVVLDGTQYRALVGTRFEKSLELIHTSKDIPTPPIAVLSDCPLAGFGRKLARALVGMGTDPDGEAVLGLFRIEGFVIPAPKTWAQLEARFRSTP